MRKNGSRTESDVFDLTRDLDADRLGEIDLAGATSVSTSGTPVLLPPYLMLHVSYLSDLWHMFTLCLSRAVASCSTARGLVAQSGCPLNTIQHQFRARSTDLSLAPFSQRSGFAGQCC